MKNRLAPILLQKKREIADLYQHLKNNENHSIAKLLRGEFEMKPPQSFKSALKSELLAVIAEIKRRSPSKGMISPIIDPIHLAQQYINGKASALSILTDKEFFNGHLDDLITVSQSMSQNRVPILRKDFIIDKIQIAEAFVSGASAVLCIISAVGLNAKSLIEFSRSMNIDVLVEIHDETELKIALDCGADIIGVNNRNLHTFEVDTTSALRIVNLIPDNVIKVAESGITHPSLARKYHEAGFDAVLIGEALVRSASPANFIKECIDG